MIVYLADLRYNYQGVTSLDGMPVGIGYMKAVLDRELPEINSEVFAFPDDLLERMDAQVPDVLMLSNYMWNEQLSLFMARHVRSLNKDCLVVMGGPNIPVENDRKIQFMRERPEIDLYATGEGDFYVSEILSLYLKNKQYKKNFFKEELHSSVYKHNEGDYVVTPIRPRTRALDDIPSPWLTGIMDKFFHAKMAPLFETNRGCPFTCTFCVQGTKWYTKVNYFSMERLEAEIDYIGRKIAEVCPEQKVLRIVDANFGMYNRDVEIAGYLGKTQKMYKWPLFIDATTGKNRSDNIIKSIEAVNGALWMYQAVQSLDNDVLNNISRKNIKLETYKEIQGYVQGRGLRSSSDLIIGLPGQSLNAHIGSLKKTINSGTSKLNNFQAMMLKGSDLETQEARDQYGFTTKFRLLPKNFGVYHDQLVMDVDEIVVSTSALPFEDYIKARIYHFVISVFWNESRFDPVVRFMERLGFEKWDFIQSIFTYLTEGKGKDQPLIISFVEETRNELFDSEDELHEFYSKPENLERVLRSEIGDNLMYKYRAIASFWHYDSVCDIVYQTIWELLEQNESPMLDDPEFKVFWEDWKSHSLYSHAHGKTVDEVLSAKKHVFHFDIRNWLVNETAENFASVKLSQPQTTMFVLDEEKQDHLSGAFKIWDYQLKSMPMIVKRIHNTWQERDIIVEEMALA